MKTKNIKSLQFSKTSVAKLDANKAGQLKGGSFYTNTDCISVCPHLDCKER
ncbi:hypothetical protein GTQ40_14255 [Flavobacteriaceae bacterium R38]|nr:hypothetical protein [Flavobacteriaceae bacterium R38]